MASSPSLVTYARSLLDREDNAGLRPSHIGYLVPEAFQDARYADLLPALDARLSRIRYSLISMLLAGIYFGLLVGHWLFSTATWQGIAGWAVPVGLVGVYAVVTARNMLRRMRHLHETRAVLGACAELQVRALSDEP
jgi:hypothetical protein